MNVNETQNVLDNWDTFISGNFLKAVNVPNENEPFICVNIEVFTDVRDNTTRPRLSLENKGTKYDFDLNKTNSSFLKEKGVVSPRALIGKKIFFRKVRVHDPTKNMEVDGLRIDRVE